MSQLVAGNVYDKYGTRNPIARLLMAGFDRGLWSLLRQTTGVESVLEIGCGEGEVTAKIQAAWPRTKVLGCDISQEIIDEARRRHPTIPFEVCSVLDIGSLYQSVDLIVACEVLEHVEEPERALREIVSLANRYVFVSVPREPFWRVMNMARGKYLRDFGNTPGHIQHWSRTTFLELLRSEMEIIDVRSPLPWTQVLGRRS